MSNQRVEITLTKECLDTVEEFIEKYSVLAAQEIIMNGKKG